MTYQIPMDGDRVDMDRIKMDISNLAKDCHYQLVADILQALVSHAKAEEREELQEDVDNLSCLYPGASEDFSKGIIAAKKRFTWSITTRGLSDTPTPPEGE